MKTKMLFFVVLIFLLVPGSGQLRWNGIPLSSRLEFATLAVFVLVLAQRDTRRYVAEKWNAFQWRGVVVPVLLLVSFAKVLTFAWSPFGDGFDACYRSLYVPLENPFACEKSYEGPFLRQSDLGLANTSRTDRTIDFGIHQYDWSLPFMNEYPRLGSLWLERFPFSAKYGAILENSGTKDRFLPILSIGKMTARLGSQVVERDYSEHQLLSLITVPPGRHEFTLDFEYRDDEVEIPPDDAPPVRGPYASLKVGTPQNLKSLRDVVLVRFRGWAFEEPSKAPPTGISVTLSNGTERTFEMTLRQDIADFFGNTRLKMSGFDFLIPRSELGNVSQIRAQFGSTSRELGKVTFASSEINEYPSITPSADNGTVSDFSAWLTAERESVTAFAPDGRRQYGLPFELLALMVELMSAMVFLGLFFILFRVLGFNLIPAIALGTAGWITIYGLGEILPSVQGVKFLLPLTGLAAGVIGAQKWLRSRPNVIYLPLAGVLAHHQVFDHLRRFHFSQGIRWWGRLHFWWRDSDWYATRGLARTIFLEGSLEGGHRVFWFQAGPRYWAFFTQVVLGENDVLIGLLMITLGFFVVLYLSAQFINLHTDQVSRLIAWLLLTVGMIFQSDDMFVSLGFLGASEHPTWLMVLAVSAYLLHAQQESRTWLLILISGLLAYMVPMRPNQIGGALTFFVLLLFVVARDNYREWTVQAARMITTFSVVVSLALLHNLYYGESFVPFAANGAINVQFEWTKLFNDNSLFGAFDIVFLQLRAIFYWVWPVNWSWALIFWGSQFIWLLTFSERIRQNILFQARTLILLLPLTYALPMLKYQLGSYYPRHLVVISLSCLCAGLLAWPGRRQLPVVAIDSVDGNLQVNDRADLIAG